MDRPISGSIFFSVIALFLLQPFEASAQSGRTIQTARALKDLFAAEWDYTMQQNPTWASRLGHRRWNDRWEDAGLEAIPRRHAGPMAAPCKARQRERRQHPPPGHRNCEPCQNVW